MNLYIDSSRSGSAHGFSGVRKWFSDPSSHRGCLLLAHVGGRTAGEMRWIPIRDTGEGECELVVLEKSNEAPGARFDRMRLNALKKKKGAWCWE